jgi:hypothetical protein
LFFSFFLSRFSLFSWANAQANAQENAQANAQANAQENARDSFLHWGTVSQ